MEHEFRMYKDKAGQFRWTFVASNGQKIADSGEGYTTKENCRAGIDIVKTKAPGAPVKDNT